jgi:DNA-binding transcriptional MerR regulator
MFTKPFVLPSEIERETGFGRDQLRKWRQRFGFPPAESMADGKVAFSSKSVEQLHLIKRLLDGGFRPGQVVGKTANELETLCLALGLSAPAVCRTDSTQTFIDQLKRTDLAGFRALLAQERAKRTLSDFVRQTLAPLMTSIGDAWKRNELDIHHEHLCSCCVERYLHAQVLGLKPPKHGFPSILFALPPGERHDLGLLMIESVLAEQGARTISLGSDIPLNNLKLAAISYKVDVVVLSFSFAYPARDVAPTLLHLRRLLPIRIQIWAGGAGVASIRKHPKGVRIFPDFEEAVVALDALAAANLSQHEHRPTLNAARNAPARQLNA